MKLVKGLPCDAKALKRIHIDTYQKSYRGYLPDEYLDSLVITEEVREKTAKYIEKTETYFVECDNEKVAFVYLAYPEDERDSFEIMAIYVHPNYHRKGVGRFIVDTLSKMKKDQGFKSVIAWTMKYGPSKGFYEKMGFVAVDGMEKIWRYDIPLMLYKKDI